MKLNQFNQNTRLYKKRTTDSGEEDSKFKEKGCIIMPDFKGKGSTASITRLNGSQEVDNFSPRKSSDIYADYDMSVQITFDKEISHLTETKPFL